MNRVSFSLFAGIALTTAGFGISSPALAQPPPTRPYRTVNAFFAIGCPEVVGSGDGEFNGNGPEVEARITLRPSSGRTSIFMDTWVDMEETVWDNTHGIVDDSQILTTAPAGTHFTHFWDGDGHQWLPISEGVSVDAWRWGYTDNDRLIDDAPTPPVDWLISVSIMGDTEGDDIGWGEDCDDLPTDSHIEVQTNTMYFAYGP